MSQHVLRLLVVPALIGLLAAPPRVSLAAETPPSYPALSPEAVRQLDRKWEQLQRHEPELAVRDVFNFLLTAAARSWRPEKLSAIIDLAESLHDRDPASATYGNYRWYWRDPKPDDRNAVEFSMQAAGLAWVLHRDRLPETARERLRAAPGWASGWPIPAPGAFTNTPARPTMASICPPSAGSRVMHRIRRCAPGR